MSHGSLVLLGGGGHAAVVAEAARAAGWSIAGYLDDDPAVADAMAGLGLRRLGSIDDLATCLASLRLTAVHAAVGDPALRAAWLSRARAIEHPRVTCPALVHPDARLSPSASIAPACFVGVGAVVNARARVDDGAIVNSAAVVEHDAAVGSAAHVAPRAVLGGGVDVGPGALVGLGAIVLPGRRVGAGATIGAGAVVTSDIPDGATARGVPARWADGPRSSDPPDASRADGRSMDLAWRATSASAG